VDTVAGVGFFVDKAGCFTTELLPFDLGPAGLTLLGVLCEGLRDEDGPADDRFGTLDLLEDAGLSTGREGGGDSAGRETPEPPDTMSVFRALMPLLIRISSSALRFGAGFCLGAVGVVVDFDGVNSAGLSPLISASRSPIPWCGQGQ
jgi:hypothetical protein